MVYQSFICKIIQVTFLKLMVRISPLPLIDRVSVIENIPLVLCLLYRLYYQKYRVFTSMYIIAESCFSTALLFVSLEKGPIFIFWTAYPVAIYVNPRDSNESENDDILDTL